MKQVRITLDYDEICLENRFRKLIYVYRTNKLNYYQYIYRKSVDGFIIGAEQTDGKVEFNG